MTTARCKLQALQPDLSVTPAGRTPSFSRFEPTGPPLVGQPAVHVSARALVEPELELDGGDRAGHLEALDLVAAVPRQVDEGSAALDALGDHAQPETVGQADGGDDERGRAGIVGHREHEGAVELELVDREIAQVGKGAVAGAEVIDGDLDPAVAGAAGRRERVPGQP